MTQAEVLKLWEAGRSLGALDRAVLVASVASPDKRSAADWPLGARNRSLAQLHCDAFGGILRGYTACRQCGEHLEFEFDGHTVATTPAIPSVSQLVPVGKWLFRLPTSRDLARIADVHEVEAAVLRLLDSCRLRDAEESETHLSLAWSKEEIEELGEKMSLADPLAEIALSLDCPVCKNTCEEALDLPAFLWAEVEARARRILQEVHALALNYGWHESEILALSDTRRAMYLQMVQA